MRGKAASGFVDSANTVTAAYLQGVNRADVDGIIAYYDLYGQGVYNAIAENDNFNGKNGDALPWRLLTLTRLTLPTCRPS